MLYILFICKILLHIKYFANYMKLYIVYIIFNLTELYE